jgi:C2H2-type zinc finger
MSSYKDTGEKSDESTSNASASFTCEQCGKTFNSRQELRAHTDHYRILVHSSSFFVVTDLPVYRYYNFVFSILPVFSICSINKTDPPASRFPVEISPSCSLS